MTAASYTSDLTAGTLYTDTEGSVSIATLSGGGGQNSLTDPETDDYIQGANSASRNPWGSGTRAILNTIGSTTIASGDALFLWAKADVGQLINSTAGGGVQVLIGNSTNALNAWYVNGNEDALGGWRCYVVDPSVATDNTYGNPNATRSVFGVGFNIPANGPSKGFPFKLDAIRHGRFATITGGTAPDAAATLDALATQNDLNANQWGQFSLINGVYQFQGGLQLGTSAAAVRVIDSSRAIFILDTIKVTSGFNRIEINNASSIVDLTAVSITSLGTTSKGTFVVVDNATVTLNGCTFVNMGTFTFNGGTNANTITGSTFRNCETVTQAGAVFTGCTFDSSFSSTSVVADDVDSITGCTFISDGTGHAVDLGTVSANTTVVWDNVLDDGAGSEWTGTTGVTVGVSGTANDAILVNVTGSNTLTVSVEAGATIPTIRNTGTGTVDIQAGNVTLTVTVQDGTGTAPVTITDESVNVYIEAAAGGPLTTGTQIIKGFANTSGVITDTRSLASDQPITGWARRASAADGALPSGTTYFKQANITGTFASSGNTPLTVVLSPDE